MIANSPSPNGTRAGRGPDAGSGSSLRTAGAAAVASLLLASGTLLLAGAAGPATPEPVHFNPGAQKLSIYEQMVRVQVTNKDISFEAPEAYRESFAFWTGRMKNVTKTELIEFTLTSLEPNPEGFLPFRRQASRFMIEIAKDGMPMEPYGQLQRQVTTLVWEGLFDRFGNVVKLEKTAGADNPEMEDLTFPFMDSALPRIEPMKLRQGEGFTDTTVLPLPSRLQIKGLEDLRMIRTRTYVLDKIAPTRVVFTVKTTYANDPESVPTVPDTFCTIKGEGEGEASFDLRRGLFLTHRDVGLLTIDLEAPLRPLPGKPETEKGGSARSHLELELRTTVHQKVRRVWGDEED